MADIYGTPVKLTGSGSSVTINVPAALAGYEQTILLDTNDSAAPVDFDGLDGSWGSPLIADLAGENNRLVLWSRTVGADTAAADVTINFKRSGTPVSIERIATAWSVDVPLQVVGTPVTPASSGWSTSHSVPAIDAPGAGLWVQILASLSYGGRALTPAGDVTEFLEQDSGSYTHVAVGKKAIGSSGSTGAGSTWTSSDAGGGASNYYAGLSLFYASTAPAGDLVGAIDSVLDINAPVTPSTPTGDPFLEGDTEMAIKQSEATATRRRIKFTCVDSTTGAVQAALTFSAAEIQISKNGAASANSVNAATVINEGGGAYWYEFDAAEINTLGRVGLRINKSGTKASSPTVDIVAYDPNDATALGLGVAAAVVTALKASLFGEASFEAAIREIRAAAFGVTQDAGTTSEKIKDPDTEELLLTVTLDANNNRTAVARTLT